VEAGRLRYREDVAAVLKALTADSNDDLKRQWGRSRTTLNVQLEDLADAFSSQAMAYCKASPDADKAKWGRTLKTASGLVEGAKDDLSNAINTVPQELVSDC
jgi:hypothetical protein